MTIQKNDAYRSLLASNVWDTRYQIPACPMHLNPHIYTAYAVRVLESLDASMNDALDIKAIRLNYCMGLLNGCEKSPGVLMTYPDTTSAIASHDDALGAGFLNSAFAARCVQYLAAHDGEYTPVVVTSDAFTQNSGGASLSDLVSDEMKNDYRFLFYLPAMKAFARYRVGLLSQLQYALDLFSNLYFEKREDNSGRLLMWLTFPVMREAGVISSFSIWFYTKKMMARGLNPREIFRKYYLTECPWFAEWAREDWA